MTSEEFTHWQAFYRREPFGFEVDDYHAALVAATVANTIPRKAGAKAFRPEDFMTEQSRSRRPSNLTDEQRAFIDKRRKGHGKRRHNQR